MGLSDPAGVALEILAMVLATIFVLLRAYVQIYIRGRVTGSDGFIIVAYLIFFLIFVGDVWCYKVGQWDLNFSGSTMDQVLAKIPDRNEVRLILKILYVSGPLYFVSMWCVKGAFILLYFELIPKMFRVMRAVLWMIAAFTLSTGIASFLLTMLSCQPIHKNWALDGSLCFAFITPYAYWFAVGTHALTDLCIFITPFFLLSDLHLSTRRKVGVAAMFALGFISIAMGVVRVILVELTGFRQNYVNSMSAVEMATAIIVACAPQLKNIWRHRGTLSLRKPSVPFGSSHSSRSRRGTGAPEDLENGRKNSKPSVGQSNSGADTIDEVVRVDTTDDQKA